MESIAGQSSFRRVFRCFALVGVILSALLTGCSHTPDSCLTGEHYGNVVHPGEIVLLPLYVAGCYATADWADPDNLAIVAPVADDETSAMDRYYEGLLKDKRDNEVLQ